MIRPASILTASMLAALAAGCTPPPPPTGQARADQAAAAACRRRADDVYERQNRAAIFTGQNNRDSPLSGAYQDGIITRGLGDRYARDNLISDCIRSSSGPADVAGDNPGAPAGAVPPSAPSAPAPAHAPSLRALPPPSY